MLPGEIISYLLHHFLELIEGHLLTRARVAIVAILQVLVHLVAHAIVLACDVAGEGPDLVGRQRSVHDHTVRLRDLVATES